MGVILFQERERTEAIWRTRLLQVEKEVQENQVNILASPKPLSDTNQPMDLIGLPTTRSISLTPPAWEKLVGG